MYYDESVGGGLWADMTARVVPSEKALDECGLASGVLSKEEDRGLGIKITLSLQ